MAGRNCGSIADSLAKELPQNRRMAKAPLQPNADFSTIIAPAC